MKRHIKNYTKRYTWEPLTVMDKGVISFICSHLGESEDCLSKASRKRPKVFCRFLVAKYLRDVKNWSYTAIGTYMKRDHSTIIYYTQEVEYLLDQVVSINQIYSDALSLRS